MFKQRKSIFSNLVNKYTAVSEPVKASIWFTFSNILQKALSLLATPILTRILSTEQYGTFTLYQSWVSILTIFTTLNIFQNAFNRALVQYPNDHKRLESSLLGLTSTITLLLLIIYIFFKNELAALFNLSFPIVISMFVEIMFVSAYEFWAAEQRFNYKYWHLVIVSVLMSFGSLILGIVMILLTEKYKAEARIYSDVGVKILICAFIYINIIKKGKVFYNKNYWKYAIEFSLPLVPHFLSHFVLNQSDRILIGNIVGTSQAAIYSVAYSIAMMMVLITEAINNTFVPFSFKELSHKKYNSIKHASSELVIFVGLLCLLPMMFAPEIIELFASSKYHDAIWVVPPISASVFFIFIYNIFSNIEYYYKRTIGISLASILSAVLNLALNLVAIKLWGYLAAAYTTLLAYIILAVAHYFMYKLALTKKTNIKDIYNLKMILLSSSAVIFIMFLMLLMYNHLILRYVFILLWIVIVVLKKDQLISLLKSTKN